MFIKRPFSQLDHIIRDENLDFAVGLATLGIPLKLYIQQCHLPCLFRRKQPNKPVQRAKESDSDYLDRKKTYDEEVAAWQGKKVPQRWVRRQTMKYGDLEDESLEEESYDTITREWYRKSVYKDSVPESQAVRIVKEMEKLYEQGRITKLCDVKHGAQDSEPAENERDLYDHLEVLKKKLPAYKLECDKIMQLRQDIVNKTGLGEELDKLLDSSYSVEDLQENSETRLTLFQKEDPPEFLKAKMKAKK